MHDARIIHNDIQPSKMVRTRFHGGFPVFFVGDVSFKEEREFGIQAFRHAFPIGSVDFKNAHACAFMDEFPNNAFAEPEAAAGDDGDAVFETAGMGHVFYDFCLVFFSRGFLIVYSSPRGSTWAELKDIYERSNGIEIETTFLSCFESSFFTVLWFWKEEDYRIKERWQLNLHPPERINGQLAHFSEMFGSPHHDPRA